MSVRVLDPIAELRWVCKILDMVCNCAFPQDREALKDFQVILIQASWKVGVLLERVDSELNPVSESSDDELPF